MGEEGQGSVDVERSTAREQGQRDARTAATAATATDRTLAVNEQASSLNAAVVAPPASTTATLQTHRLEAVDTAQTALELEERKSRS